jgi:RNA polymerase sigma factor (sigma-70 family)
VVQLEPRAHWLAERVVPHEPALRRWLQQKQMRGIEVDDVIQDTYALLARMESVADIRNPKAYIYQTAYSLALICLRRARLVAIQPVADIDEVVTDTVPSAEEIVALRQELSRAAAALQELPQRCREVFILRKIHGLSQREVAARMAITEGTVEKQVHKASQRLADIVGRGRKSVSRASRGQPSRREASQVSNKEIPAW